MGLTPEKQVEQEVMQWLKANAFSVDIFDSKATWSPGAKTFRKNRSLVEGCADLLGVSREGYFVAIELKAPKKETVCRAEQRAFLERKIRSNGFGIVVSSVDALSDSWSSWLALRKENKLLEAQQYLLNKLPKKVLVNGRILVLVAD